MSSWLSSFLTVFYAVAKIGVIIAVSGYLIRKEVIPKAGIKMLSNIVIALFLPCLIFSNVTTRFFPENFPSWWLMPICAVLLAITGWVVALVINPRRNDNERERIPLSFLQNAGYLVLPLGISILGSENSDQFILLCFLYILGHNPVLWLVGRFYLNKQSAGEPARIKDIISPPLVANLLAIVLALTGLREWLPDFAVETAQLVGEGAVPLATFVLGATLGGLSLNLKAYLKDALIVNGQKLILMPLIMIAAMALFPWLTSTRELLLLFILQAASAPATALVLQIQTYGDNPDRVATIVMFSYCGCVFTIPLWTTLALHLYGG